jgi:hypothetical protein
VDAFLSVSYRFASARRLVCFDAVDQRLLALRCCFSALQAFVVCARSSMDLLLRLMGRASTPTFARQRLARCSCAQAR